MPPVATPLELAGGLPDAIKAAIQAEIRQMMIALPVIVDSSDQHVTKVHSAILGLVRQPDGTTQATPMPPFETMPVHFPAGGRVVSTFPVQANDEGVLLFAARALDTWHQSGGQQPPIDARQHHASDGFFFGGIKSDPNKIANKAPDAIHHRSLDGRVTHEIHPDNGTTTKVVPASDPSSNPFASAATFYRTIHNAASGIVRSAVQAGVTHLSSLTHAAGHLISIANGAHTMSVHPSTGIAAQTTASIVHLAQQNISQTAQNGSIIQTAAEVIALNAPSVTMPLGSLLGSALGNGSTPASALASGAASTNVGALGGDLSGALPNPNVVGCHHIANGNTLPNAANDAGAAALGVAVGGFYRNGSIVMTRIS